MPTNLIPAQALLAQLNNPDAVLVDIRASAAFNGWRLQGEKRGGRISGAVNLALPWVDQLSSEQAFSLLLSKGISPKKNVILYGCQQENCQKMAALLQNFGIQRSSILAGGIQSWAADPNLPMVSLEKYEKLVHPAWMTKYGQTITLIEASWQGQESYQAGHIPGAIHFDLSLFENHNTYNILPDSQLSRLLPIRGITAEDTTVVYGKDLLAAFRAAWLLMYAGVEDVRVLDGGYIAWKKSGFPVETGEQQPAPAKNFGASIPAHPEYHTHIDAIPEIAANKTSTLVSVRSWDEYTGQTSGYNFIKVAGRIPGAVWGTSGQRAHEMQDYRNPDHTMRSAREIAANWQKQGITPAKKTTFYCGTGWRASEAFFYAYLMGWKNISVYDGGWYEWSRNTVNPTESGVP